MCKSKNMIGEPKKKKNIVVRPWRRDIGDLAR